MSTEPRPNYTRGEWFRMEYVHFVLVAKFKSLGLEPISECTFEGVEAMEAQLREHYDQDGKS